MIRTGAYRDSWRRKDSPNHLETVDAKEGVVQIGSKLPYAAAHQDPKRKGMPKRAIRLTERAERDITAMAQNI